MEIHADDPIDLTGLNKRDIRDIKRSMVIERQKLEQFGFDTETNECMMSAIYRALIVCSLGLKEIVTMADARMYECKKINKEKYTPKKYKKPL